MHTLPEKPYHFFSDLIEKRDGQIYAILDSAKNPEIPEKLWWFDADSVSLYKGEPEEKYADIAPYLTNLSVNGKKNTDLMEWIFEECWGGRCGIFFVVNEQHANPDMDVLLKHFQKLLIVTDEAGRAMFFRFYDPSVFKSYLPACTVEERLYIFGVNIETFFVEDEGGVDILKFESGDFFRENSASENTNQVLVIRNEQIQTFKENKFEKFRTLAFEYVIKTFPGRIAEMPGDCLNKHIDSAVTNAFGYNLTTEFDVMSYVKFSLLLGWDFDKNIARTNKILCNERIGSSEKTNLIASYCNKMY